MFQEAGKSVFGNKWENSPKALVLPNAIDAQRFIYKQEVRDRIRKKTGIEDCFVLGHVGRFHYAKNHEFLLEIFAAVRNGLKEKGKKQRLCFLGKAQAWIRLKKQRCLA